MEFWQHLKNIDTNSNLKHNWFVIFYEILWKVVVYLTQRTIFVPLKQKQWFSLAHNLI